MNEQATTTPAIVARQAIYDTRFRVVAYELLFRPASSALFEPGAGTAATAQVLMTAFTDIGLDKLVGRHHAYVNVPHRFLVSGYCSTLPKDRVVLEILEDVVVDDELLRVARALVADGHTLALDDFMFRPGVEPLVELAAIVKLDILALSPTELVEHVERLRDYDVTLVAEKVEDAALIPSLRDLGFAMFQGYALQRPKEVRGTHTRANRAVLLEILAALQEPAISATDLVEAVARDPSVAYALLRVINSAHLTLATKITSLRQALVLLGVDGVRNWTTMMIMSRLVPSSVDDMTTGLIRAKMAEICAAEDASVEPAAAFTAGLLSALPAILGRTPADVVRRLGLAPHLRRALLDHEGPLGRVLAWVLGYEASDQERLGALAAPATIACAYIEAVEWSTQVTAALSALRD